jgi:hypothetical protein
MTDDKLYEKIALGCMHFSCQRDNFNFIAIHHCGHKDNPEDTEGNCTESNCPTGFYNAIKTEEKHND